MNIVIIKCYIKLNIYKVSKYLRFFKFSINLFKSTVVSLKLVNTLSKIKLKH